MHPVAQIVNENNKGRHVGIWSCCSASEDVIRASLLRACRNKTVALIESTSNQVNQEGGYTGMTPADFAAFVHRIAFEVGISEEAVVVGGDHLGPLPWVDLVEDEAMRKAEELVEACVMAGYSKIHLDTSMRVASDDPDKPFLTRICAERGARLCRACEKAFAEYRRTHPNAPQIVYVIGSEVPVPGGDFNAGEMGVTTAKDAINTFAIYKEVFENAGLKEAFDRVVAIVVEMGVEFHEFRLDEYDRRKTAELVKAVRNLPLCIEGHSSDYQTAENLRRMCEDGVAILKAGPAMTFSQREALFALEAIEREVYRDQPGKLSRYRRTLDKVMMDDPSSWESYYTGDKNQQRIARAYSFYDRCRYYFAKPEVVAARQRLIDNLSGNVIPLCLLSQYLPNQYYRVRSGELRNEALDILLDRIGDRIDRYLYATNNNGRGMMSMSAGF